MLSIKKILTQELTKAIESEFGLQIAAQVKVKVEYPPTSQKADYACPVALEGARFFKKPPNQTAKMLGDFLEKKVQSQDIAFQSENNNYVGSEEIIFEKLTIAGPGFINFHLSSNYLDKAMADYSQSGFFKNVRDQRILVSEHRDCYPDFVKPHLLEFVSANPTGPMNIVSARAASFGNCLANLWRFVGIDVKTEFYVNDYGNQVDLLAQSVAARYLEGQGVAVTFPEGGYQGDYVYDLAKYCGQKNAEAIAGLIDSQSLSEIFCRDALEHNLANQQQHLKDFGVEFDNWFSERSLHDERKPALALEMIRQGGWVYEQDGKQVFRSMNFGDDKDRVLVRDDGRATYFLADISYHIDKIKRGYEKLVNIWGPDHHGYIARLKGSLIAAGYPEDILEIIIAQQVNLIDQGVAVKMSKRLGRFTTMEQLLKEIPKDVARYFFIMRSADSPLDFDIALAQKRTLENPVYYIQYAHARICSVLRENEQKLALKPGPGGSFFWQEESRRNLALMIIRFFDTLVETAVNREIHRLAKYLEELAAVFQSFYQNRNNRVLDSDPSTGSGLLRLMLATKNTIATGLGILGVTAPEKM